MSMTAMLARRACPGAAAAASFLTSLAGRSASARLSATAPPTTMAASAYAGIRASSTMRATKKGKPLRRAKMHIVEAMVGAAESQASTEATAAAGTGAELSPKEQALHPEASTMPPEQRAKVGRALELLDQHPALEFRPRTFFEFPRRHSAAAVNPNYFEDNEEGLPALSEADKHTVAAASKGWYPGHQRTAERNMPMLLRKARAQTGRLPLVIEVRDARIPLTGINPVFERMLQLPNPNDLLAVRAAAASRGELPFESVLKTMKSLGLKYKPNAKTLRDLDLEPVLPAAFARLIVYTRGDLIDPRLKEALRVGIERKHREFGLPKAYGQVMFVDTHKNDDLQPVVEWLRDRAKELSRLPSDVSNWHTPRHAKGAFRGANEPEWAIRAVALGMPNSGKSSLVNAIRRVGVNGSKAMKETSEFRGTEKVSTPVRVTGERIRYGFAQFHEGAHGKKRLLDQLKFEQLPEQVKYERRSVPPVYVYDTPGINMPYLGAGTMALHRVMRLSLVGAIPNPTNDPQSMAEYILFKMNRQYGRQIELWRERQRLKILDASPEQLDCILEAPPARKPRHLADEKHFPLPNPQENEEEWRPSLSWGKDPASDTPQLGTPSQSSQPPTDTERIAAEQQGGTPAVNTPLNTRETEQRPEPSSSSNHALEKGNAVPEAPYPVPTSPSSASNIATNTAQAQLHKATTVTLEMPPEAQTPSADEVSTSQSQENTAPSLMPEDGQALESAKEARKEKRNALAPWMLSSNRELDLFLDQPPIPDYSRHFRFKRPPPPTNVISHYLTKLAEYTPQGYAKGGWKKLDTAARYFVKRAMTGWLSCTELDMQPWDELDANLRGKITPRQGQKPISKEARKEAEMEEKMRLASLPEEERKAELKRKALSKRLEAKLDKRLAIEMRKLVHQRLDAHVAREQRRKEEKRGRFQLAELEQDEYEGRHGVMPGQARGSAPGIPADVQARMEKEASAGQDTADRHGLVVSHASHGMPTDDRLTLAYDPGVSPRQLRKRWKMARQRRQYRKALAKGYHIPLRTLRRAGLFKMTRAKRSTRWLRNVEHHGPIPY